MGTKTLKVNKSSEKKNANNLVIRNSKSITSIDIYNRVQKCSIFNGNPTSSRYSIKNIPKIAKKI